MMQLTVKGNKMEIGFPDQYPATVNLPFNRTNLDSYFQISTPGQDPGTPGVWLILQGKTIWVEKIANAPALPKGALTIRAGNNKPLYIGTWQGHPCRVIELPPTAKAPRNLFNINLMDRDPTLQLPLFSLAGIGMMTLHWDNKTVFCCQCGSPLIRSLGKWSKKCLPCNKSHYPCLSTCVISLVVKGDEILLVRKPEWKDRRFGLVAGFAEFGECLEEAISREIKEETNIEVQNIRYVGSQSWPFPNQIMAGYVADYAGGKIAIQKEELAEADWYKLDNLPLVPPRRSIARYLIDQAGLFLKTH